MQKYAPIISVKLYEFLQTAHNRFNEDLDQSQNICSVPSPRAPPPSHYPTKGTSVLTPRAQVCSACSCTLRINGVLHCTLLGLTLFAQHHIGKTHSYDCIVEPREVADVQLPVHANSPLYGFPCPSVHSHPVQTAVIQMDRSVCSDPFGRAFVLCRPICAVLSLQQT